MIKSESKRFGCPVMYSPVREKGLFFTGQIILAEETSADVRPVVVNRTLGIQKKFAAVFNNQLTAAGQGKVKSVGAQVPQFVVFIPGNVYGGKRAATIGAAFPAAFQIADGVIQHHYPPSHPVACEGDLEDGFFLVVVEAYFMKRNPGVSRKK
jgi:hypothetical protein